MFEPYAITNEPIELTWLICLVEKQGPGKKWEELFWKAEWGGF